MRSFLFVPGDSVRKFESAKKTAADALILDLEDSIAPEGKVAARGVVRQMLDARNPAQKMYIRVNALDTGMTLGDLAAVVPGRPDGILLPKCAGSPDVNKLALYLDAFEVAAGIEQGTTRIVTVATETARAVLKLMDFENMSPRLWGMMWGAEDLAASLAASRKISRPCSPTRGGWRRIDGGVRLQVAAGPARRSVPSVGCSTERIRPTAARCGSSIRLSRSCNGACGMSASAKNVSHSAVVFVFIICANQS